jgi:phage gp16-like protein
MGKSNGEDKIDTKKMSEREMLLKIIELTSNEDITAQELREILDAVIKVTSKRR